MRYRDDANVRAMREDTADNEGVEITYLAREIKGMQIICP